LTLPKLTGSGSWPSLNGLGTDRTGNTTSNSSSFVVCVSFAASAYQQTCLQSRSPAMAVSAGFTVMDFSRQDTALMMEELVLLKCWYLLQLFFLLLRVNKEQKLQILISAFSSAEELKSPFFSNYKSAV
jgi:hypothetical protein